MVKQRVDYYQYMASREWRLKRRAVIEQYGNWCRRCLSAPIENVHHLTYERLGDEDLDDLLGVCRPCHEYISAVRDDDPAVTAVWDCINKYGLSPEVVDFGNGESRFLYWHTGPTSKDKYFCIDFKNTSEPDDYIESTTIVIPFGYGVWMHAYWL